MSDLPDPHSTSAQPDIEKAASHSQQLADKILLGLSSKRSDEEWEYFVERTIQMFREKGLFKRSNQPPES